MEPPDYGRPSTWVRYKPSLCDGCRAHCCRLPVEVTVDDLVRLGWMSEDDAATVSGARRAARRLAAQGKIQNFRARTGLFILAQRPDERCRLLGDDGRCTVYERRPETCRRFPAEIGPRVGFCPSLRSV